MLKINTIEELDKLKLGQWAIYHVGFLANDRLPNGTPAAERLNALSNYIYRELKFTTIQVLITRKEKDQSIYEYRVKRTKVKGI